MTGGVVLVAMRAGLRAAAQAGVGIAAAPCLEVPDTAAAMQTLVTRPAVAVIDVGAVGVGLAELLARAAALGVVTVGLASDHEPDAIVRAFRAGLRDFVEPPHTPERIAAALQWGLHTAAIEATDGSHAALLGRSPIMAEVRARLAQIAASAAATVLVTGETGTGKDVAARAIHAAGPRCGGPFVHVTCSALPPALLESELFGHERGAFTDARARRPGMIELAEGGTLFLDEIGELEPSLQARLLRFLDDKVIRRVGGDAELHADVRVIAATHVDLARAVADRRFRADLYHRLAVLTLRLPPLRERGDDVLELAEVFLRRLAVVHRSPARRFSDQARAALRVHTWPGNVRELRNAVERAVVLSSAAEVDLVTPCPTALRSRSTRPLARLPEGGVDLQVVHRRLIEQALSRTGGNLTAAARLLGLNRDQVRYRLAKFNGELPAG